jgi:hypothetical protein
VKDELVPGLSGDTKGEAHLTAAPGWWIAFFRDELNAAKDPARDAGGRLLGSGGLGFFGFDGGELSAVPEGVFGNEGAEGVGADVVADVIDGDDAACCHTGVGGHDADGVAEGEVLAGDGLLDEFGLALRGELVALKLAVFALDLEGLFEDGGDFQKQGLLGGGDAVDKAAHGALTDAFELGEFRLLLLLDGGDFGFFVGFGDDVFHALLMFVGQGGGGFAGIVAEDFLHVLGQVGEGDGGDAIGVGEADLQGIEAGDFHILVGRATGGGEGGEGERRCGGAEAEGKEEEREQQQGRTFHKRRI